MQQAIAKAVKAAGATGLQVGGKLMVRYSGNGQPSQRGFNPPKLYEARYKLPETGEETTSPVDGSQAQPAAVQAAAQAPMDEVPF